MSGGATEDPIHTTIRYFTGNPRSVGHKEGILRVCLRSDTVCVENVPKFILPTEVLGHFATYRGDMVRFRILGCVSNQAQYYIVIRFSSAEKAEAFKIQYNRKQVTALGNEVLFIRYIETGSSDVGEIPTMEELPRLESSDTSGNCPVCLEELHTVVETDEGEADNGALWTTMCGHTAHMLCLQKWDHSMGCPVCRFNPQELGMVCSDPTCQEVDPLWMCLVCGHLGCGRYQKSHAEAHYRQTAHTYCLEVYTGSVWDYAGDGFVHRLVANRSDGKPVNQDTSVPSHEESLDIQDAKFESQMDGWSDAYSGLLESQLESQRSHFEGQLDAVREELAKRSEELATEKQELATRIDTTIASRAAIKKETAKLRKRLKDAKQRHTDLAQEVSLERSLLDQAKQSIPKYKEKLESFAKPPPALASKKETLGALEAKLASLIAELESP